MRQLLQWLPVPWRRAILALGTMPLGRRLVRGALASLGMTGVSIFLGLVNSVLSSRLLGPENYGLYSFAMLLTAIATVPFWFGMTTLLTRETGRVVASGTRADMTVLLRWCFSLTFKVVLAVTTIAGALAWLAQGQLGAARYSICLLALPMIGLSVIMPINITVLRGIGGLVRSQFCDLVARPSINVIALVIGLAILGRQGLNANVGLAAQILAVLATSILSGFWLFQGWREMRASGPAQALPYSGTFRLRELLMFSAYATLGALYGSIDGLLLNAYEGNSALGIYRIALVGVQLIVGFTAAVNTIAQPSIASLYAAGDSQRLQRLLTATARSTALLAAIPVAILIIFAQPFLRFAFGAAYVAGAHVLAIAALGQLATAFAGPVANLLILTGHEKTALRCLLAGTALNAGLCLVLIPQFGMTGAAVASVLGGLLLIGLMSFSERRLTGLTSSIFGAR